MRLALVFAMTAAILPAQRDRYDGPKPPKRDVPFLLHANKLVELDVTTAQAAEKKDDTIYTVPGPAAKAQTPLAEPIFLVDAEQVPADKLDLFRMTVKGGSREVTMSKKQKRDARPIRMTVNRLEGSLYRVEVQEFLENGEYCMSPQGSNQVFCFAVF